MHSELSGGAPSAHRKPQELEQPRNAGHEVQNAEGGPSVVSMPKGAPAWITQPLIAATIEAWQADYDHKLTTDDAVEILLMFDRLVGVLEESDDN